MRNNDFEVMGMMRAICNLNRIGESVEFIAEGLGLSEACVNRVLSFAPYFEQTKNSRRESRHNTSSAVFANV